MGDKGEGFDTLAELMARAPAPDLRTHAAREQARAALLGTASFPTLGRFEIHGELGRGGMGTVYAAFDPQLQRTVAIKVVQFGDAADRDDMLREARALARLEHPNVVAVYEADATDRELRIAMELVRGQTLRAWLRGNRRRDEIIDMIVALGRGLAAAHAAGVIHGDVKPDNVLVADDGRPRLVDFGLARVTAPSEGADARAGGTRGYVAPELLDGAPPSPPTDVFALAVTLVEGLTGERLAAGAKLPPRPRLPRWIDEVVRGGLEPDPARRYRDASAFVSALTTGRRRSRRRRALAGATMLALTLGGAMFSIGRHAHGVDVDPCESRVRPLLQIWNDGRRALLAARFGERSSTFLDRVDARARDLVAAETSACHAAYRTHESSEDAFDREAYCLQGQAGDLDAVVASVEATTTIDAAQVALSRLPPASECEAAGLLQIQPPPGDPVTRARVDDVRRALAKTEAMRVAGELPAALTLVERASSEADAIAYAPLRAQAYLTKAHVLVGSERFEDAHAALQTARDAAVAGRDDRRLVTALLELADLTAEHQDRPDEAGAYLDTARAIASVRPMSAYIEVQLHGCAAVVAAARKDVVATQQEVDRGLATLEHVTDAAVRRELEIGLRSSLAAAQVRTNRLGDAEQALITELRLLAEDLGPENTALASTLDNLARVQISREALDRASDSLARAKKLLERAGAARGERARNLELLALIQSRQGHDTDAVATYREALALETAVHGDTHRVVWSVKSNLAKALLGLGQTREAIDIYRGRLDWAVQQYGPDHGEVTAARINLANAQVNDTGADVDLQLVLDVIGPAITSLHADDPVRTNALATKARALDRMHRYGDAVDVYARALAGERALPEPRRSLLAYIGRKAAESAWSAGQHRAALSYANEAVAIYRALPGKEGDAAELATWIAAHKGR